MEEGEYGNIYREEDSHWWYWSLHREVLDIIKFLRRQDGFSRRGRMAPMINLLDAGCGAGGMLKKVKDEESSIRCAGLDVSSEALKYCRQRRLNNLVQSSVEYMPFAGRAFEIVVSLDVLYHLQVGDDIKALVEMHRIISSGGYIILQLPAYEFLRGGHDKIVHTRQRYTLLEVRHKVEKAGFTVIKCSYRNMFLLPFIYIKRRGNDKLKESDLRPLPVYLNNILKLICLCENWILKYFNLPFGSSILCLAKKI